MVDCNLAKGDLLALYTDGVTEANNGNGEEFGEEQLIERLCHHRNLPCQELVSEVANDVRNYSPQEQHDDITMIVARGM
jgi:serine phosphatase RsbU (regulator of sigma subunit)